MNLEERLKAARANLDRYRLEAANAKKHLEEQIAWRNRSTSAKQYAKMDQKVKNSENALALWNKKIKETQSVINELKKKMK